MAADFKAQLTEAMFGDYDLVGAQEVFAELKLPATFSESSIATIDAAINVLADKAAVLKLAEAPRAERKEIRAEVDRLINARALLYRLRSPQAGDVKAEPAPVGGTN